MSKLSDSSLSALCELIDTLTRLQSRGSCCQRVAPDTGWCAKGAIRYTIHGVRVRTLARDHPILIPHGHIDLVWLALLKKRLDELWSGEDAALEQTCHASLGDPAASLKSKWSKQDRLTHLDDFVDLGVV